MINAVGVSNPIKMLNAVNAFKGAEVRPSEQLMPETSNGIDIENDILKTQNLEEIKQVAKTLGEENISDEDIKYGVTYGRSVIADYIA